MATLSLFADLSRLVTIREFVAGVGRDLGLDDRSIYELQLAVDEACANVVLHGYGGQGGEVKITVEAVEGGVAVHLCVLPGVDPAILPAGDDVQVAVPIQVADHHREHPKSMAAHLLSGPSLA